MPFQGEQHHKIHLYSTCYKAAICNHLITPTCYKNKKLEIRESSWPYNELWGGLREITHGYTESCQEKWLVDHYQGEALLTLNLLLYPLKKKKQQAITSLVDQSSCDAARASLTFTAGRWCSLLNFNSITEHQYHTGLLCNGNGTRVRQLQSRIWIQRKIQHCSVYKNNWISLYHG